MNKIKYQYHNPRIVSYEEEQTIKDLLLYHKIQKIDGETLLLDNGVKLKICPNEGCGGCSNGWYAIDELNECDNAITDVKFEEISENGYDYIYQIFVYAENREIKLLEVSGSDGNGYYGSGYRINVISPVREQEENYDYGERENLLDKEERD